MSEEGGNTDSSTAATVGTGETSTLSETKLDW